MRKLTANTHSEKLKKRQGWEVHSRSVKRHLFRGLERDFKITLRRKWQPATPSPRRLGHSVPRPWPPPPPLPRVSRKRVAGRPRAGPPPLPGAGRNEPEGMMKFLILLSGWEDYSFIIDCQLFIILSCGYSLGCHQFLFLPTYHSGY